MRRVILLVICLALLLSPASAHSGGTDSQGGHWNHSTGEYHFHHGRGPHQHPGGVCPYDSSIRTTAKTKSNSDNSDDDFSERNGRGRKIYSISMWNPWIILSASAVLVVSFWTVPPLIAQKIKQRKEEKEYLEQKKHYEQLYKGKHPIQCVNVPEGSMVDDDGLPRDVFKRGVEPWGPTYTVFTSMYGTAFHKREGCCGAYYEAHIYDVRKRHTPCKKCNPVVPDLSWFEEYKKIRKIKSTYRID